MNESAKAFYEELKDLLTDKADIKQFCSIFFNPKQPRFTKQADKVSMIVLYRIKKGCDIEKKMTYRYTFGEDAVLVKLDEQNQITLLHTSQSSTISCCCIIIDFKI